jgi:hypothetical protein
MPVGAISFTTTRSQRDWPEAVNKRMPLIASLFSHALERKRAQLALEERLRFQQLLARVSTRFADLFGAEVDRAIQEALAQIGEYFDVDSVRLYRLSLSGEVVKLRVTWRAEGLAPPNEMPELLKRNYAGFAAHYSQGESIFGSSAESVGTDPAPGIEGRIVATARQQQSRWSVWRVRSPCGELAGFSRPPSAG